MHKPSRHCYQHTAHPRQTRGKPHRAIGLQRPSKPIREGRAITALSGPNEHARAKPVNISSQQRALGAAVTTGHRSFEAAIKARVSVITAIGLTPTTKRARLTQGHDPAGQPGEPGKMSEARLSTLTYRFPADSHPYKRASVQAPQVGHRPLSLPRTQRKPLLRSYSSPCSSLREPPSTSSARL